MYAESALSHEVPQRDETSGSLESRTSYGNTSMLCILTKFWELKMLIKPHLYLPIVRVVLKFAIKIVDGQGFQQAKIARFLSEPK